MNTTKLPKYLRRAAVMELAYSVGISNYQIKNMLASGAFRIMRLKADGRRYYVRDSVLSVLGLLETAGGKAQ